MLVWSILIAGLISPYRKDWDACLAMLPEANFIEARLLLMVIIIIIVTWFLLFWRWSSNFTWMYTGFMNMPLKMCKAREMKGLYKLAQCTCWKDQTCAFQTCLTCNFSILTWLFVTWLQLQIMTWKFIPIIGLMKWKKLNCNSE